MRDKLDGENLSWWLIPEELADEFEGQWAVAPGWIDDRFDRFNVFAVLSVFVPGTVSVRFGR